MKHFFLTSALAAFILLTGQTAQASAVAQLTLTTSSTPNTDTTHCNGTALVSAHGGSGSYSYNWSNGAQTPGISGLCAGTYTVTVYDINGNSMMATTSVTVHDSTAFSNTFNNIFIGTTGTNNTGCNVCNGSASVYVQGGSGAYVYLWSNGATSSTINGLCGGTYSVTISDAANVSASSTSSVTIKGAVVPSNIQVNGQVAQPLCSNGGGSISINPSGGSGGYTVNWNNGSTSYNLFNLQGGNYTVTVADTNGCTATASYLVNNAPALLVVTASRIINASCSQVCNGNILAAASGGTAPYSYQWGTGVSGRDSDFIINLCAGNYPVTVTDVNGCTASASFTVGTSTNGLIITPRIINASCPGIYNGNILVTPSNGPSPFTYSWSTGVAGRDSDFIVGLCAGTYTVSVTAATGCSVSASYTVGNSTNGLIVTPRIINASCPGICNGNILVTPSNGPSPFTYSWSTGVAGRDSDFIVGLCAGTYAVSVTAATGCSVSASYTVGNSKIVDTVVGTVKTACANSCNGQITVTVSNGPSPFTYKWDGGQTTSPLGGLCAGTYRVTVTDAVGCTGANSFVVTQNTPIAINAQVNQPACSGYGGSISINPGGGTGPGYTASWSNGSTSYNVFQLLAGTYSVTVTDANGCTASQSFTINAATPITPAAAYTYPVCTRANGTIQMYPHGGTAPYTFEWSTGDTASTIRGLAAGNYTVTITDAKGCSIVRTFTLTVYQQPLGIITSTRPDTCGSGKGSASVAVTSNGNATPIIYAWSTGATTASINGLVTNTYRVSVTDNNGCSASAPAKVGNVTANITAAAAYTYPVCNKSNGTIQMYPYGGAAPYTFKWSTGDTASTLRGLAAGNYTVTITDANGCSVVRTFILSVYRQPVTLSTSTRPDTCGSGKGSASVTVTSNGNASPFTYAWSTGATTSSISKLTSNTYQVTVTDNNGCSASASAKVGSFTATITAAAAYTYPVCTKANGTIQMYPYGGTAPYTFKWSTGDTASTLRGLAAGNYTVTAIDANGCSVVRTFALPVYQQPLTLSTSTTPDSCNAGKGSASVTITSNGNATPFVYGWSTGAKTASISGLKTNTYQVSVTDNNGCSSSASAKVGSLNCGSAKSLENQDETTGVNSIGEENVEFNFEAYPNPFLDVIHIKIQAIGNEPAHIRVFSISGQLLKEIKEFTGEGDIHFINNLAPGVYLLQVTQGDKTKVVRLVKAE